MISISTALVIFIFVAFIATLIVAAILSPKLQDYKRMKERQADLNKIELQHQGGSRLYTPPDWGDKPFNYMIHSWDGGKNWYATEYDQECEGGWGIKILGDASVMYPGLLEHIEGMDALTDYVEKHGAIDGTDPAGLEALEDAGFTVKLDTVN